MLNVPSDDLVASWERTRGHLARAWVELPAGDEGEMQVYVEYLDQNELGLAMETLAESRKTRVAGRHFWLALADAADEMKLSQEAGQYRTRAQKD